MSRGLGRIQRAVLAHLATEPLGRSALTGLPAWSSVREIAAAVFGVERASEAQVASVRRAVRTLAAAGWIDYERLALEGVTYVQQRGVPRRPPPRWEARIEACTGAGCPACAAGTYRYAGWEMDLG
ncbi:hypothetical protein [Kitasatospora sp. LaBMicrA B282]|uniref:hypothetical protein n=1 Tax=Kitasatospora sp. LaBMicrA B282 TaxID=3420949 RepID=UPI003D150DCA